MKKSVATKPTTQPKQLTVQDLVRVKGGVLKTRHDSVKNTISN